MDRTVYSSAFVVSLDRKATGIGSVQIILVYSTFGQKRILQKILCFKGSQ
jgi:hypothetical protein